jgi:Holliday junction resolvase RusA-like endonuclease
MQLSTYEALPVVTFPVYPTEPAWSTNQDRKMNHFERHKYVTAWKNSARMGWKTLPIDERTELMSEGTLPPAIVQVVVPFFQKRRRDPHNYCGTVLKAIVDGLVEEGLWPDDNPEWIGHRESQITIGNQGLIHLYLVDHL